MNEREREAQERGHCNRFHDGDDTTTTAKPSMAALLATLVSLLALARAQEIAPANITYDGGEDSIEVALADRHGGVEQVLPVWPLMANMGDLGSVR